MKKKLLVGVVSAFCLWGAIMVGAALEANVGSDESPVASQQTTPTTGELLNLVNAERAKYGAAPLAEDPRLSASAQFKASDETIRGYFGHIPPGETSNNGLDFADKLVKDSCSYVSENLTQNVKENTSQAAVVAWIKSPLHHTTMIDPKYTLTGFGISGNQIVEHFCQPF